MWDYNIYGLKPMNTEEAWNAANAVNEIRKSKIEIGNYCHDIKQMVEDIQLRARNIPEEDDAEHKELVRKWTLLIRTAYNELLNATNFAKR